LSNISSKITAEVCAGIAGSTASARGGVPDFFFFS
jgi:hypothetical protein